MENDEAFNWERPKEQEQEDEIKYSGLRYMLEGQYFLLDSVFCEFAYICNVDTMKLEIYKGFNRNPKAKGRYASKQPPEVLDSDGKVIENEFYGVSLYKTISFKDVRKIEDDQWGNKLEKEMSEEA